MIPLKEYMKQRAIADKLVAKQKAGKFTEADRIKWLKLDLIVREVAVKNG